MPKAEIDYENSLLADPTWLESAERNPMVLIWGRVSDRKCGECESFIRGKCTQAPP